MRKTKQEVYYKANTLKQEENGCKILAKSPLIYRQRKIPGQASAIPANRTKQRETNIFKVQKNRSPFQSPVKDRQNCSESEVIDQMIFKQLEEEIQALIRRQQNEFRKLQQIKLVKEAQIKQVKKHQHAIKLEIWQLRNETMELKDALQSEQEEYEKLLYELGISQQEFEDYYMQVAEDEADSNYEKINNEQQPEVQ